MQKLSERRRVERLEQSNGGGAGLGGGGGDSMPTSRPLIAKVALSRAHREQPSPSSQALSFGCATCQSETTSASLPRIDAATRIAEAGSPLAAGLPARLLSNGTTLLSPCDSWMFSAPAGPSSPSSHTRTPKGLLVSMVKPALGPYALRSSEWSLSGPRRLRQPHELQVLSWPSPTWVCRLLPKALFDASRMSNSMHTPSSIPGSK